MVIAKWRKTPMRRIILLLPLLAVVLIASNRAAQSSEKQADPEVTKKEVIKAEDELYHAIERNDTDVINRIWADDIAYTTGAGEIQDKATALAAFRSGAVQLTVLKHDEIRVHVYGNTVVVTGRSTSSAVMNGGSSKGPRRFTDVWVKLDGRWRLVVHHVSFATHQ
jgi:ketosteroid isomerase-like protein